jgi:hypothetical protein
MPSSIQRIIIPVSLLVFSIIVFFIVNSGHSGWSDDFHSIEAIENFWSTGRANTNPYSNAFVNSEGVPFSKAEIGVKLQGSIGYLLFKLVPGKGSPFLGSWEATGAVLTTVIVSALTVLAIWWVLILLGVPSAVAALMSLPIVGASPVYDISGFMISTSGGALAFVLGTAGAIEALRARRLHDRPPSLRAQVVVASGAFLLLIMRPTGVLFAPAIGLAWIYCARMNWRPYIIPSIGTFLGLVLKLWYNYHRSGSFFTTGYKGETTQYFIQNPLASLYSTFFIPRFSIFTNSPLVIFGVLCIIWIITILIRRGIRFTKTQNIERLIAAAVPLGFFAVLLIPIFTLHLYYVSPQSYKMRYQLEVILALSTLGCAFMWHCRKFCGAAGRMLINGVLAFTGLAGIYLHLPYRLATVNRVRDEYSFLNPSSFDKIETEFSPMPLEAFEFWDAFARFPHPDWLIYYLSPDNWYIIALILYILGSACLILGLRSLWKKSIIKLILLAMLIAAPVVCITRYANAAVVLAETELKEWAPLEKTDSDDAAYGVNVVQIKRYKNEYFASYRLVFPKQDEAENISMFDSWVFAKINMHDENLAMALPLGSPHIHTTYWWDLDLGNFAEGSTIWVNGRDRMRWPYILGPDNSLEWELNLARKQNSERFNLSLGEISVPLNQEHAELRYKREVILESWMFLSNRTANRGLFSAVTAKGSNSAMATLLPHSDYLRKGRFNVEFGFYSPISDKESGIQFIYGGKQFEKKGVRVGPNTIKFQPGVTQTLDDIPLLLFKPTGKLASVVMVPAYIKIAEY